MKLSNVLAKLNPEMKLSVMRGWTERPDESTTVGELSSRIAFALEGVATPGFDPDPEVWSTAFLMKANVPYDGTTTPTVEIRVGWNDECVIYSEIEG